MSYFSATDKQLSMAAGVQPQSYATLNISFTAMDCTYLVQFQSCGTRFDHIDQSIRLTVIAFAR